jgi:hypothetical protein
METNMALLRKPFEPRPTAQYVFGRYMDDVNEWTDYLQGW